MLLTVLAMSLLLMLSVAFSAQVRLALRELDMKRQLFQAQANARLGAELAIAKLQETAGPDTRVTAPIRGVAGTQPNKLLVGQAIDASAYRSAGSGGLEVNPDYTRTLGYFISGSEDSSFDPLAFWPFDAVGNPTSGNALLVGKGSVSDTQDENSDGVPDGYVAAPIIDVQENGNRTGGFAWWISDEGLKAQINVIDELDARVAAGDWTASQAELARKATAQKGGTEAIVTRYTPTDAAQNTYLARTLNLEHVNMVFGAPGGPDVSKEYFHSATLESLGLLTNTRRGGLMRDLMAVMKETASNGNGLPAGDQWDLLMDYQESRINQWANETMALEAFAGKPHHEITATDRPSSIPERHWNAMQAITLRTGGPSPQNSPDLADRIFPPMSDMHTRFDQGGAGWEQLMTWPTLLARRLSSGAVVAQNKALAETTEISPVIARINISAYATLDYPKASLHFVPMVVLWNPYNVPIRMKSGSDAWRVIVNFSRPFQNRYTHNYWLRVRASNPQWTINGGSSRFNHIPDRNKLWTSRFLMIWQNENDDQFVFDLRDVNGGTNVEIGPGQARIFTMHESHVDVTPSDPGASTDAIRVNPAVVLREGMARQGGSVLPNGGHFSVYRSINLEDQMDDPPGARPPVDEEFVPTPAIPIPGYEPGESINHWHALVGYYRAKPYPFPVDPAFMKDAQGNPIDPTDNRYLYNGGWARGNPTVNPPQPLPPPNICINTHYFRNGWDFHQLALEFGRDGQGGNETLQNLRVRLQEGTVTDLNTQFTRVLQEITLPYNRLPESMSANGGSASDFDTPEGATIPVFDVHETPSDNEPLDMATDPAPGFPAWGMSWALRLPENSFKIDFDTAQNVGGSAMGDEAAFVLARTRWMQDFNPTAPFAIRDPSSKELFGFDNPASYVGGYFIGSQRYGDLDWATPDGMNQFIGNTDDTLGGTSAILFELPQTTDEIVSVASLSQAPLLPTKHALSVAPNGIPGRRLTTSNRDAIPYEMAQAEVNYHYMQPVNAIGNSTAHLVVDRDKAVQSFFPNNFFTAPRDAVPYGSSTTNPNAWSSNGAPFQNATFSPPESYMPGYDSSWVYNEVLWDDFFFTSEYNTRYLWRNGRSPGNRDFTGSAENLLLSGAFNINSTSVDAWEALLTTMMGLEQEGSEPLAPFRRLLSASGAFHVGLAPDVADSTIDEAVAFTGYRRLTGAQLRALAEEIVSQVRERGPFLSLSDFVNRALVRPASDPEDHGLAGAIQAAIDATDLNNPLGTAGDAELWVEGADEYNVPLPSYAQITNVFASLNAANVAGPLNRGAAGDLMQSDLLSRIGYVLRPRSDTFKIRVLGMVGDEASPSARAWCEVTVQRSPGFVDKDSNNPGDVPADLTATNLRFGRRFLIIDFRWLSEEEI